MTHTLNSPALVAPLGHYSHVAVHQDLVYISGQLPLASDGTALYQESFGVQAQQTLENLDQCLVTAGTDRSRLLNLTAYITDLDDWPAFDSLYAAWIGEHRPARAVVGVDRLHYGCVLEIQAVASLPEN
ncbi:RidA family protein [Kineosporia babensis]|uniref:RidA family protein n=1 Tax=Kineosporia babensis TaxID=499548 RepID=A0A9X1NL66_9ACTN|nr:RidA family protein [Kineosporia babensis]MCD5316193.1 RidA family protein [Kineosporia babensis]